MTDWHKNFTVIRISRADLRQTGLTNEQIAELSDEDMEAIAEEMDNYIEDYYFDQDVWEHLRKTALRSPRLKVQRSTKP